MIYSYLERGSHKQQQAEPVFSASYDILVAGLGTAGAFAAIAAARQGARVLGVERLTGMGGMATFGHIDGYYFGSDGGMRPFVEEELRRVAKGSFIKDNAREAKEVVLQNMAREAGAVLRFESTVTGVYLEDNQVRGVTLLAAGGIHRIGCKVLIDATADAEVSRLAGCNTFQGRSADQKMMPFSSVRIMMTDDYHMGRTNFDSGYLDQSDPWELSRGIVGANANHLLEEFEFSKIRYIAEKGREHILFITPHIGVREGRRIEARYQITAEAVLNGTVQGRPLFYAFSDFDKHGKDNAMESETLQDFSIASNLSTVNFPVPVPFEAMLPKRVGGLIAAGRHIGVDHDTASLIRMVADMQLCGQAAGTAAAVCVKEGVPLERYPYEKIREILLQDGCYSEAQNSGCSIKAGDRVTQIQWRTDPAEIRAELSTERPGLSIWSCRRQRENMKPYLLEWLQSEDKMLRYNSAIALGVMGDAAGAPVLLDIVHNRDCFYFKDCRRTNQLRSAIAIYLLGKLRVREAIAVLCEMMEETEFEKPFYDQIKELSYQFNLLQNFNEVKFQLFSQAICALVKLAKEYPQEAGVIRQAASGPLKENRFIRKITGLPENTFEYQMLENIGNYVRRELNLSFE